MKANLTHVLTTLQGTTRFMVLTCVTSWAYNLAFIYPYLYDLKLALTLHPLNFSR